MFNVRNLTKEKNLTETAPIKVEYYRKAADEQLSCRLPSFLLGVRLACHDIFQRKSFRNRSAINACDSSAFANRVNRIRISVVDYVHSWNVGGVRRVVKSHRVRSRSTESVVPMDGNAGKPVWMHHLPFDSRFELLDDS